METIKKIVQNHPVSVIGLALLGIISGGVTIYAWLFPPSQKPVYNLSHVNIITPSLTEKASGLNITYNGETIDNLTISKIGFINLGKEVIKREDIPDKGRFYLQFNNDEIKIYDKRIIFTTENANNPSIFQVVDIPPVEGNEQNINNKTNILKQYNNRVYLDFDYLAYNEGIIIQIAHSGSNYKTLDLKGLLPGNPAKYKVMESIIDTTFPYSDILSILLFIGILSGFLIIIVKENKKTTWDIWLMIISIIPLIFFCFSLIVKTRPYIAQFTSKKLSNYHYKFDSDWNLNSQQINLKSTEETKEIDGIKFIIERQK